MDDEIRRPIASGTSEDESKGDLSIVNLPVHIDSTSYLIHPVGKIDRRERGYYGSGSSSNSTSTLAGDQIYGSFTNLRFQEINSEEFTELTDENFRILSVRFLREIFENTGKQFLLYKLIDTDTNADEDLDNKDGKALYISGINGSGFRKVSPDSQVLQDYKVLQALNRLYFRSLEDENDSGMLDANETLHYFYLDLTSEELQVTEYFPLDNRE